MSVFTGAVQIVRWCLNKNYSAVLFGDDTGLVEGKQTPVVAPCLFDFQVLVGLVVMAASGMTKPICFHWYIHP